MKKSHKPATKPGVQCRKSSDPQGQLSCLALNNDVRHQYVIYSSQRDNAFSGGGKSRFGS